MKREKKQIFSAIDKIALMQRGQLKLRIGKDEFCFKKRFVALGFLEFPDVGIYLNGVFIYGTLTGDDLKDNKTQCSRFFLKTRDLWKREGTAAKRLGWIEKKPGISYEIPLLNGWWLGLKREEIKKVRVELFEKKEPGLKKKRPLKVMYIHEDGLESYKYYIGWESFFSVLHEKVRDSQFPLLQLLPEKTRMKLVENE